MLKKLSVVLMFLFVAGVAAYAGDVMGFVPQDSALVLSVNLTKIFASPTVKKQIDDGMAKQSPDEKKKFDEFVTKTGLDPLKDLTGLIVYVSSKSDPKAEKPDAAVLLSGNFKIAQIIKAVSEDEKAKVDTIVEKFEGLDCIKGKKESDGLAVFLDANTVAIGMPNAVKAIVEVKNGKGKPVSANEALGNLLKKADTNAIVWGVGILPQNVKDQAKANPQMAPLAALNSVSFAFNHEPDLNFNFAGDVDKKESMDGVMTALNGTLAMVKMLAGQSPEASEILSMIKVDSADLTAKISLNVPKAKFEELKKKIEEKAKSGKLMAPPAGMGSGSEAPAPAPETPKDAGSASN